ncbi:hypothetical protein MNBD_GAMMA11-57, partial [hydrothermal vent metagenome]
GEYGSLNSSSTLRTPPSGSNGAYTIIKAENDGNVVINKRLFLKDPAHHIQFEGLKWKGPYQDIITGNNIKVFRCAFEGGPSGGNTTNVNIGSSDFETKNILIEDSWFYGPGGRYTLLIIWSSDVIIRRTAIRHDGGWNMDNNFTPESGITIYNSARVQLQNVIVLDSITTSYNDSGSPKNFTAAFYNVSNKANRYKDTRIVGSISFNNIRKAFAYDDSSNKQNAIIENCAAWRPDDATGYFAGSALTIASKDNVVARNLTLINSTDISKKKTTTAVANWGSNSSLSIKNSIVTNASKGFKGVSESFNVCDAIDKQGCNSENGKNYNPQQNGLKYITRIEEGSRLQTDGEGGGVVGATIINRIGKSGTLYGETDFDILLDEPLWPWPNEAVIGKDFCSITVPGLAARGLCSSGGKTLTAYIWGALGNELPEDLSSMPSPKNTRSIKN